ncbi:MAG: FG-GAP repeat protein [Candidatus Binatia bacterium]
MAPTRTIRSALAMFCLALVAAPAAAVWDTLDTGQAGQWTIYARTDDGAELGMPVAGGDLNGDGLDDVALTPMNADSGPDRDREHAGEVAVVFSNGTIAGIRDLATLDVEALPDDILLIYGADAFDYLGIQVTAVDLDTDGFADLVIGAQYGDGPDNGRANSGDVAIVWGGTGLGGRAIDLRAPAPGSVTFVYARDPGDRLGTWVSSGDFDGDGAPDLILGADEADGPDESRTHAGETYVLYGGPGLRSRAAIDLAAPATDLTVIYGIDREDHSGGTVRGADLDHDGAAEVLIGAGLNRLSSQIGPEGRLNGHGSGGGDGRDNICDPVNLRCDNGEAYIVYGAVGVRPATIDLVAPPASTTFIYGVYPPAPGKNAADAWGEELFAGDFDGDGWLEVAIGALIADGPGDERPTAGDTALIRGGPGLRGSIIELGTPPPGVTFFYGAHPSAIAGDTLMLIDVDGDGRDDLVIAGPNDRPQSRIGAGTVFIFFGTAAALPAEIDLAAIPAEIAYLKIDGADDADMLAYSMAHGDVNGDGLQDPILNVMGGDGFNDQLPQAGDVYVLNAVDVSLAAGRAPVTPTPGSPAPTATATPTPTATPTAPPTVTAPARCVGDCSGDGTVSIAELITAVRIALGAEPIDLCPAADRDGNGAVSVGELIGAVNASLGGCG